MTLCRAAALALAAWYLMMPPLTTGTASPEPEAQAPLGNWIILGTFDTADATRASTRG